MREGGNYKKGMAAALACAVLWGFLPIYWKILDNIPSNIIIFYRIFWVGVTCFICCLKIYGYRQLKSYIKNKEEFFKFIGAGLIITSNWSIYIWAVNAGYIIQTSIGYYTEPLMVCAFGILIFKEQLTKYKSVAFLMALLGVCVVIIHFGDFPLIALGLALTFAVYAAIKKTVSAPPLVSLFYETSFFIIPALLVIIYMEASGIGALKYGSGLDVALLTTTGLATAVPLGLFGLAAANLPLITLGITEYVSPSISLIIGIFLYREPFDFTQLTAFFAIWIGLIVFTVGEKKEYDENR